MVHFMAECCLHGEAVWQDAEFGHVDVFGMCGGTARVPTLLVRRRHVKVGLNFDAVVGIYLLDPYHSQAYWAYMRGCEPI